MSKLVAVFCAIVAIASATSVVPRDLVDQAIEQLKQLEAIVQGEISVAHDKLASLITEFKTNEITVSEKGTIDLQQEEQSVLAQLTTVKDLAHAAGKDISSCTDVREQTLQRLPARYTEQMNACISELDTSADQAQKDAKYLVDIYINKVHDLRSQVNRCHGELLCISPLLTEIELDKIRLPQNINTEVLATESLLTVMKLSVASCADNKVAQYATEAYSILADIEACADRIIG